MEHGTLLQPLQPPGAACTGYWMVHPALSPVPLAVDLLPTPAPATCCRHCVTPASTAPTTSPQHLLPCPQPAYTAAPGAANPGATADAVMGAREEQLRLPASPRTCCTCSRGQSWRHRRSRSGPTTYRCRRHGRHQLPGSRASSCATSEGMLLLAMSQARLP